jgi:hypothetical protein
MFDVCGSEMRRRVLLVAEQNRRCRCILREALTTVGAFF